MLTIAPINILRRYIETVLVDSQPSEEEKDTVCISIFSFKGQAVLIEILKLKNRRSGLVCYKLVKVFFKPLSPKDSTKAFLKREWILFVIGV